VVRYGRKIDGGDEAPAEDGGSVAICGFVDSRFVIPLAGYPDDSEGVFLGLDEVDIEAEPVSGLTIRTDLNMHPTFFDLEDDSTYANLFVGHDSLVEQGYARADFANGALLVTGKMNAPFGAEALDAPDSLQASTGQVFDLTPGNLTGFFGGWESDSLTAMLWVVNPANLPAVPGSASAIAGRSESSASVGAILRRTRSDPIERKHDDVSDSASLLRVERCVPIVLEQEVFGPHESFSALVGG
jgi:hypothetical protein